MSKKFISTRPGGFKITLNGKQQVFPMNEVCEVPDSIALQLPQYAGFIDPYEAPVNVPYVPDPDAPIPSDDDKREEGKTSKTENAGEGSSKNDDQNDLAALGLTDAVMIALVDAGFNTKSDISEAIDSGKVLSDIPGIGVKTQDRIIEALAN